MEKPDDFMASFRAPLMALGTILIVAGAILLLYVAMLVYQILNTPGDVAIVKYILEKVNAGDMAFYGTAKDARDATKNIQFEVHWDESVRLICFLFIGVFILGILTRILAVLINCGSGLVKLAGAGTSGPKRTVNIQR